MLQKPKSNRNAKFKFFLIIPLLLAMLTYVACSEDQVTTTNDAQETHEMLVPPVPPTPPSPPAPTVSSGTESVPFPIVQHVPVFPGCEIFSDNEAQKACMSEKISEFVNANFDTGLAKDLGLSGINRIQVMFKINKNGEVVDVKARSANLELQEEAVRVVKMLPNMSPGKQDGKPVSVIYSLPIIFQVE